MYDATGSLQTFSCHLQTPAPQEKHRMGLATACSQARLVVSPKFIAKQRPVIPSERGPERLSVRRWWAKNLILFFQSYNKVQ